MDRIITRGGSWIPNDVWTDPRLDHNAIIVYGMMRSFGNTCEETLEAQAERAKRGVQIVRDSQKLLQETGWLILLKEGSALEQGKAEPRAWFVRDYLGQKPDLRVLKTKPLKKHDPKYKGVLTSGTQTLLDTDTDSKTDAKEKTPWQIVVDAFFKAFREHPHNPEHADPHITGAEWRSLKDLMKGGESHERIVAAIGRYFSDDFARSQGFRLGWFIKSYNAHALSGGTSQTRKGKPSFNSGGIDPLTGIE
jgi:hypothetical protein